MKFVEIQAYISERNLVMPIWFNVMCTQIQRCECGRCPSSWNFIWGTIPNEKLEEFNKWLDDYEDLTPSHIEEHGYYHDIQVLGLEIQDL